MPFHAWHSSALSSAADGVSLTTVFSPALSGCFCMTVSIEVLSILLLLRKTVPYFSSWPSLICCVFRVAHSVGIFVIKVYLIYAKGFLFPAAIFAFCNICPIWNPSLYMQAERPHEGWHKLLWELMFRARFEHESGVRLNWTCMEKFMATCIECTWRRTRVLTRRRWVRRYPASYFGEISYLLRWQNAAFTSPLLN